MRVHEATQPRPQTRLCAITGLLLTQDPVGLAGGVNLYAYAGSNPVSFSDAFGLKVECTDTESCAAWNDLVRFAANAMRSRDTKVAAAGRTLNGMLRRIRDAKTTDRVTVKDRLGLAIWRDGGARTKPRVELNGIRARTALDPDYGPRRHNVPLFLITAHEAGHADAMMGERWDDVGVAGPRAENLVRAILGCPLREEDDYSPVPQCK